MEPLGTDQASPLFSGLYRYLDHAEPKDAVDIRRVMIQTLTWYEQQGFQYFYYKTGIHQYAPGKPNSHHANSYYLPALAWAAAAFPEDPRWEKHLAERLGYFTSGAYELFNLDGPRSAWKFGSECEVLHRILGDRFHEVFTDQLLDRAYDAIGESLAKYSEPGTVMRVCPESADPNFRPYVRDDFDRNKGIGAAYHYTRHHGRRLPRHEASFLIGLAATGYRVEDTTREAAELLALRSSVPEDFTHFLSEDYEILPETVRLYARSVGAILVEWWRNYWFFRYVLEGRSRL